MNLAYIDSYISFGESTEIMDRFDAVREELKTSPRTWLVTGAAGFIGSNLVETLLQHIAKRGQWNVLHL